ncbi:MAG: hypothetical protein QXX17_07110 [Conexivisphaerales archaeon]
MPVQRPTGVAIIAILAALGGIAFIFLGIVVAFASGLVASLAANGLIAGFVGLLGGVMMVLGLLYLGLAYGFWTGKGWAWTVGVVLMILGIIIGIAGLLVSLGSVVSILIYLLILYYLTRPHVKAFFGKGSSTSVL